MKRIGQFLYLALFAVLLSGCRLSLCGNETLLCSPGTATGNPFSPSMGQVNASTESLLFLACGKIQNCNPGLEFAACERGLRALTGLDTEIGLAPERYPTFGDVIRGEARGEITSSRAAYSDCSGALARLQCAGPELNDAYQPSAESPFQGATRLFGPACSELFATADPD